MVKLTVNNLSTSSGVHLVFIVIIHSHPERFELSCTLNNKHRHRPETLSRSRDHKIVAKHCILHVCQEACGENALDHVHIQALVMALAGNMHQSTW